MQGIQVGRWLFWAGVLVLVATIVVSALYGQQLSPPFGTGYNVLPALVLAALVLLLASAAPGIWRAPDAREDPADSPAGSQ
ncbi:MAG: hypothetical protein WCB19_04415 [Thermoplasmata archaeon]